MVLNNLGSQSPGSTPLCHRHNFWAGSCDLQQVYLLLRLRHRSCPPEFANSNHPNLTGEAPLALPPRCPLALGHPGPLPGIPGPNPLNSTGSRSHLRPHLTDTLPVAERSTNLRTLTGHTPSQSTPQMHPFHHHSTPAPQIPISIHNLPMPSN